MPVIATPPATDRRGPTISPMRIPSPVDARRCGQSKIRAATVVLPIPVAGWLRAFWAADLARLRSGRSHLPGRRGRLQLACIPNSIVHDGNMDTELPPAQ